MSLSGASLSSRPPGAPPSGPRHLGSRRGSLKMKPRLRISWRGQGGQGVGCSPGVRSCRLHSDVTINCERFRLKGCVGGLRCRRRLYWTDVLCGWVVFYYLHIEYFFDELHITFRFILDSLIFFRFGPSMCTKYCRLNNQIFNRTSNSSRKHQYLLAKFFHSRLRGNSQRKFPFGTRDTLRLFAKFAESLSAERFSNYLIMAMRVNARHLQNFTCSH